jgi:hypothetical protein
MRVLNSVFSVEPNLRLINKWSYAVFKNLEDSKSSRLHYYNIKGSITEQGYVDIGKTMFTNTRYDNTFIVFRAAVDIPQDRYVSFGSVTGDDSHSIFIDGKLVYSSMIFSTNSMPGTFIKAGRHIIDVLVANGVGGAGFNVSEVILYGDTWKFTGVNIPKVEQQYNSGNLLSNTNQDKEMSLFRWSVRYASTIYSNAWGNYTWLYIDSSADGVIVSDYIKVDPSKAYTLSMDLFCTADTGGDYIGIYAYDSNMNYLNSYRVNNDGSITEEGNFYFWCEEGNTHNYNTKQVTAVILPTSSKQSDLVGVNSLYGTTSCVFNTNTAYIRVRVLNHYNGGINKSLLITNQKLVETDSKTIFSSVRANNRIDALNNEINNDNILNATEKTYLYDRWLEIVRFNNQLNYDLPNIYGDWMDKPNQYDQFYNQVHSLISNYVAPNLNNSTDISSYSAYGTSGGAAVRETMYRYYAGEEEMRVRMTRNIKSRADSAGGVAAGARDLLNRWKANGNGTLYIDDQHIAVNKIGANEIAVNQLSSINSNLGNITGGSIKIGSISGSSDESGNTTDATRGTMFKVNADGGFRLVSRDSSGGIELSSYSRALTVWEGDVIRVKVGKLS